MIAMVVALRPVFTHQEWGNKKADEERGSGGSQQQQTAKRRGKDTLDRAVAADSRGIVQTASLTVVR